VLHQASTVTSSDWLQRGQQQGQLALVEKVNINQTSDFL
jgi:hypothetical protein